MSSGGETDTGFSAAAAKWLIPSVSALFLVVGYVIRSAHVSLLGTDFRDIIPQDYGGDAADFLSALPTVLFDFFAASAEGAATLSIHKTEIYAGVVLLLLVPVLIRLLKTSRSYAWIVGVALFLAVGAKFMLFDAPLALIESVAVGSPLTDKDTEPGWKPPPGGNFAQKFVRDRAKSIWAGVQCQRLEQGAAVQRLRSGAGAREEILGENCPKGADLTRDEFVMQIAATALIVLLAVLALAASSRLVNVLGLLSLLYCFTLPYAYGKLLKPTDFQYGWVELNPDTAERVKVQLQEATGMQAIILGNGSDGLNVLYMHEDKCSGDRPYKVAKIWTITRSQILAVREIYREDLIRWKLINEKACGPAREPIPDNIRCKTVPPERWKHFGLTCP